MGAEWQRAQFSHLPTPSPPKTCVHYPCHSERACSHNCACLFADLTELHLTTANASGAIASVLRLCSACGPDSDLISQAEAAFAAHPAVAAFPAEECSSMLPPPSYNYFGGCVIKAEAPSSDAEMGDGASTFKSVMMEPGHSLTHLAMACEESGSESSHSSARADADL